MSENIRPIIVDLSKRFGGASTRTITLAQGLKTWNVAVAGLASSPVVEMAKANNIPVLIVGRSRIDPLIPFRLAKFIRQGGYQILDTQNIQSKFWGSIAALLTDSALISTLNSWYVSEHGENLKGKIYTLIDLLTNWKTKRYIVVSKTIQFYLYRSGVSQEKIDLIRNAISIKNNFSLQPEVFRENLGIPSNGILCVAVGRLVWAKGFEDLISAFSIVASKFDNVYTVIIGDGILFDRLQKQIKDSQLSNRVFLLGFKSREEVLEILNCSNIFIMPSRSEGLPFALLEAAAVGMPIVATRCGGITEVVSENEAMLIPVGDTGALASGIETLLKDPNKAVELGKSAMNKILDEFNVSAQISATKQSYINALKETV